MSNMFVHKTAKSMAVLPFYATATVFFLLLSVLLVLSSSELTAHYFSPKLLAIAHTAALGWGTMMIFGAAYQLLPVIFQEKLFSDRMAFVSYILLLVGTVLLVWCFWVFNTGLPMVVAGSMIVLAATLYCINVCCTSIRSKHSSVFQYFLVSSAVWLFVTTFVGLLLAINLSSNFIARNHLDMLKLHAHAGIVGWFLQLICGVGARLIPMFLLSKSKRNWLLYTALALQNTGLVFILFHGYFRAIDSSILPFGLLVVLGIIAWVVYIVDVYRKRIRKKVDVLMRQSLWSLYAIPLAIICLAITFVSDDSRWTSLYGTFIFLGWITGLILGQTFKTLPFIIWNSAYKEVHGTAKIPLPKDLFSARLTEYQSYLFAIAMLTLTTGIATKIKILMQADAWLWVALALLYGYNVATVLFHKKKLKMEIQFNSPFAQEEMKAQIALMQVIDPELHINIIDLGLVYAVDFSEVGIVTVRMTLSTPHCPMGDAIEQGVRQVMQITFPDLEPKIELVWEPEWNFHMISEAGRAELGLDD